MTDRRRLPHIALVSFGLVAPPSALAEIHDHEIRRLLYLHSSCGVDQLEQLVSEPSLRRFRAVCRNTSAFPDGLEVLCTDIHDDRSCRIETPSKTFDSLDLLRKPR
ncbi:MAG: hypothetical protein ACT4N2_11070 [Hyphomicrobium sp.]